MRGVFAFTESVARDTVYKIRDVCSADGQPRGRAGEGRTRFSPAAALIFVQIAYDLKGWDAIQQNIHLHDQDMIKDFSDDIDTLLVFVSAYRL